MIAYASTSGGVMFIPETIERKEKQQTPVSYKDLVAQEKPTDKPKAFGRKKIASVAASKNGANLQNASL